ncbi:snoRNA-binding rRNA-processing protein utp10, partial [Coemansia aciculifera]
TKAFLTMLTIITFDTADMDLFGFLVAQRKGRRLLDRQTLMAQCLRDRSLMGFICQAVFRACRLGLDYPGLHSFYAMVMSQYIGQLATIDNGAIQFIVPFVLDGLNLSKNGGDAQAAAYMVLGSLATRVTLTTEALESVLCAVAQRPADVRTMAMCLVQVLQTQADAFNSRLPARFLVLLAGHKGFPRALCQLAESFDVEMFMRPVLVSLAHYAFADAELSQFLAALVAVLPQRYAPTLCERIVVEYIGHGIEKGTAADGSVADIVDVVQLRYGQQMEDAIGAAASSFATTFGGDQEEAVHRLLYELKTRSNVSSVKSGVVFVKETATTLYLSINHADAGMRLVAAKALKDIVTGARTDVVMGRVEASELVVERLMQDDSSAVLDVVLSLPLASLVDAQGLIPALISVLEGRRVAITTELCSKTIGNLLAIDASDSQVYGSVASALFPYLLKSTTSEAVTRALYAALPGSVFGKQKGDWLFCLTATSKKLDCESAKFNRNVAQALAAGLVAQWDELSGGVWAKQLGASSSRMARTVALAVGAHAVALLAKTSVDRCVEAGALVVDAALSMLLDCGSAAVAEDVFLASVDGSAWTTLLSSLSEAQVAGGALSATLSVLSATIPLQNNMWFSSVAEDGAEGRYRDILRSAFEAIVTRADKLRSSDGMLIGRLLGLGMSAEWAQFLASVWTRESSGGLAKSRSLISFQAVLRHKAEAVDYQTVVPAVIVALADDDARVRGAAVACVKTLHAQYAAMDENKKSKKKQVIYCYDAFYGPAAANRLQYLPPATVSKFVAMLASRVDGMAGDAWAVRNNLAQLLNRSGGKKESVRLDSQEKKSVVAFLLSHVVAADSVASALQTRLLGVLELVVAPAA